MLAPPQLPPPPFTKITVSDLPRDSVESAKNALQKAVDEKNPLSALAAVTVIGYLPRNELRTSHCVDFAQLILTPVQGAPADLSGSPEKLG